MSVSAFWPTGWSGVFTLFSQPSGTPFDSVTSPNSFWQLSSWWGTRTDGDGEGMLDKSSFSRGWWTWKPLHCYKADASLLSSPFCFWIIDRLLSNSSNTTHNLSPSASFSHSRLSPPLCPNLCLPSNIPHGLLCPPTRPMLPACQPARAEAKWPSSSAQMRWRHETTTLILTHTLVSTR